MNPANETTGEPGPQPAMNSDVAIITSTATPPLTDRAIWWEVWAVLAIGVLPHLSVAVVSAIHGPWAKLPYWLNAMDLTLRSAGVSFAVLYLISRSGEPWSKFGISKPRISDLFLGMLIWLLHIALWHRVAPLLPSDLFENGDAFPFPKAPTDYILMVIAHAANGIAEELVVRAYLITRLEHLLHSKLKAVTMSALVFASYHVYYGIGGSLLFILLVGFVYGGLYLLLRRIWPFAIGHMLVNIFIELAGSAN